MAILMRPAKRVKKAKTRNSQEVLLRLQEFLEQDADTGKLVEILCGFWEDQQDAISYQELRQIALDGTVSKETLKLWSQDYSKLVANTLSGAWMAAARAGVSGQPVLDKVPFEFNTQKPGILNWLNRHGAEFVTSSTEEQKRAVEALLTKKMLDSYTVDELSRMIRPCIGLTEGQAKANARFYDNIVETLRKEHPRMKEESVQRKAREAATKYAERQHRYRAMTIAQTESAFAYNQGADEGIRQAQAQGLLGKVIKRWSSSGDDQVCGTCQGLEGMETEMDKGFPLKGKLLFPGQDLLPPAHPRCACAVEYIEVEPPYLSNGLGAANLDEPDGDIKLDGPKYLGALDDISDDVVKSTLEKYESEIVKSDIENAIVVTKSGLVFQCFGDKNGVYPDVQLGNELMGASMTHNHPVGSANEYSFSKNDINLFMEYNLKLLRGIDEKYIYELSRNAEEIDIHATLEELIKSDCDLARHEKVIEIAREFGIGYRRRKR